MEYIKAITPILIVDDDEFILKCVTTTLANLGFVDVHYAISAGVALEILDRNKPLIEIIMLDLNMPGVDGIELLRELTNRQFSGGIILISGEDERTLSLAESLARARQLRVLGSLSKPLDAKKIARIAGSMAFPKN